MWIDQRGSEVLEPAECRRLLALAAKEVGYGRLAVSRQGAPVVVPVNFRWLDSEVRIRLAEGFLSSVVPGHLVAFEVDMIDQRADTAWSVLARGLAHEPDPADGPGTDDGPQPMVPRPGDRVLVIRPDVVTGRRFAVRRPVRDPRTT
ncbi:MAG: pyridoxamine 5'-phosphate oxidase family protein [Acidimicrobiales bacterium]